MTNKELKEKLYEYITIALKVKEGFDNRKYYDGLIQVLVFAYMSEIITSDMYMKIKDELSKRECDKKRTLKITLDNIKDILKIK